METLGVKGIISRFSIAYRLVGLNRPVTIMSVDIRCIEIIFSANCILATIVR